ncbi:hypothetical protein D9611_000238 [Ephemerocybe angulata]|uniref:ubiquitinyl hydrolase 1 n=1 Tax=Ephemerocybe angulata TaxID=980116 RepID=A0A8H5BNQ6_9AGAR|nr:hypothetical protein D9611_000238 [Tulosesus angulatus]
MAGLEGLASTIYHEKQEPGSMLCAQHALNSLLQGNYFTAPDLSDIARNLDTLEDSYRDEQQGESTNMDDTGFFSVQVLDNALKVWGLNLVRWRSEEMRPYNNQPHTQLAFVLNLEQHWFTLRRFGPAVPNIDNDPGEGHWFNLNSFLPAPEWVGKLYLGMVLQQAETEGYSVFAVTQADPDQPLALPRTLADEVAATLPEPSSASTSISTSRANFQRKMESSTSQNQPSHEASGPGDMDFDEEDYELQAALQASLMAQDAMDLEDATSPPPVQRGNISLPPSALPTPTFSGFSMSTHSSEGSPSGSGTGSPEHEELDPVAASMARNRQLLERMQQQQAYAAREMWSETDLTPEENEALQQRRAERQRQEEEEEEQLRLAIEESERMAQAHKVLSPTAEDDDEDEELDDDLAGGERAQGSAQPNVTPAYHGGDRVYDDDDAEFQAALKASLEHMPPGFQHPELPEPAPASYPVTPSAPAAQHAASKDQDDAASIASTETSVTEAPAVEEPLSVDEIRRRRLARFGA